jgi:hypothetical protein
MHSSVVGHLGCFQSVAIVNSCDEHQGTGVSTVSCFMFLWVDAQEWYHWIIWQIYL